MISIPVTLQSDENGYFDRECPNENCLYQFKIKLKDWEDKVSDEEVHCPMCGHVDTSDKWWTQDQLEQIQEIAANYAMNYIQAELDKSFRSLERSTRSNKFFKITYKPGKRVSFINNPIGQMPEWEQEIACEKCGTTYSVIGSAYFCPCCGYSHPFGIPAVFKSVYTNRENGVCIYTSQNDKIPTVDPPISKEREDCGDF